MNTVKGRGISLTTNELASVLALCGYESMATDVINGQNELNSEEDFDKFLKETEASLKIKGFWNEQRESYIEEGLESLITLLVHSKKKVRIIRGQKVTFIHSLNRNNLLLQRISDGIHSLEIINSQELKKVLQNSCQGGLVSSHEIDKLETLKLNEDIFNQLHHLTNESVSNLLARNLPFSLSRFLEDFEANAFEFDNASLMEINFEQDVLSISQIFFFLNMGNYLWIMDYDNVKENEIFVIPMRVEDFNNLIFSVISDYFRN
ncbi:hypothetical protein [Peribacillus deserti]|uniref:Uncharacterized protein n=1 Tax=Peribacillus deserti TaxID=673318 RepID=A0A2N5M620_9BACI|nr:hypothetical protein [Peribacillus deserti]PLT29797.1 hypothetical protein CUU66_10865 [Peribacillus deserti]